MSMISRAIGNQLRKPSGLFGRLVAGPAMALMNAAMMDWAVGLAHVQADDQILDIGCGPGASTRRFADRAIRGTVVGLDYSADMTHVARAANAAQVGDGRVAIHQGMAQALPYQDARFDVVCAVNVVYFWPDADATLHECRRVLKPGGRIVIAIRPKSFMEQQSATRHGFTLYDPEDLVALVVRAGFPSVTLESQLSTALPAYAAVGAA